MKKKKPKNYSVLALDLAKRMGFARLTGDRITGGIHDFQVGVKPPGDLWSRYHDWLLDQLETHERTNEIVYEASLHQPGHAARIINAMVAITELIAFTNGIAVRGVHQSTLKKHATGSGRHPKGTSKELMLKAAQKKFKRLLSNDDNYIDALWLADYARTYPLPIS
jgi:hypothetical protein